MRADQLLRHLAQHLRGGDQLVLQQRVQRRAAHRGDRGPYRGREGGSRGQPVPCGLLGGDRADQRPDVLDPPAHVERGEPAQDEGGQVVVRRPIRPRGPGLAQPGVFRGARPAASGDHRGDGPAQQSGEAGRQRAPGDLLLQCSAQDGRVGPGVEVLGAAGVRGREPPVPREQRGTLLGVLPGSPPAFLTDLVVGDRAGAQPVVEQLVLEGPPDGQGLVLRRDAGTRRTAREHRGDLADGTHVHGVRARNGPVRGVRCEPRPAREGSYLLDERGRRGALPGTHQPCHAEQRGLLRRPHLVAPAVEQ
ncbi:hypothetical protein ACGFYY_31510 [Streptomyces sp. NPDC048331]|uniref:hypothetical protein n=1 Tax=Streptomyces sp. NPDC048331 TaxID=3365534 RepID=UPI003713F6DD